MNRILHRFIIFCDFFFGVIKLHTAGWKRTCSSVCLIFVTFCRHFRPWELEQIIFCPVFPVILLSIWCCCFTFDLRRYGIKLPSPIRLLKYELYFSLRIVILDFFYSSPLFSFKIEMTVRPRFPGTGVLAHLAYSSLAQPFKSATINPKLNSSTEFLLKYFRVFKLICSNYLLYTVQLHAVSENALKKKKIPEKSQKIKIVPYLGITSI